MNYALPALITDGSRFEWADLAWVVPSALVVYFALCWVWPSVMLRPLWWVVTHTMYRLKVHGRERIPSSGPVLIVCNHVTFIDWLLIWVACPRPVRFLASASHARNPVLRLLMRMVRIIPVDDHKIGPRGLVKALRRCAEVLDDGEVLVVFAEGELTRNGTMFPFRKGFERITRLTKSDVPIVPAHLAHVWGSVFSYWGGRKFWRWPRHVPYPVAVGFGEPLPGDTPAPEVRRAVQKVGSEVAIAESGRLKPVHRQFVRVAARHPFAPCFIDTSTGTERRLNYAKAYAAAASLAGWLRPKIGPERHVGVWLPSSMGGALTNVALALLGKTSVNLNYTAGKGSVESSARQTGLKTVLTSRRFTQRIPLELPDEVGRIYLEDVMAGIGKWQRIRAFLACVLLPGWLLERAVLRLGSHRIDDILTVIFSSGSTGEPKGIVLSHRNVAGNIESLVSAVELVKSDRMLGMLPFFHSFGYTITMWGPLQVGASAIYWHDPRQAKEVGDLCRNFAVTITVSTATFLRIYIKRCQPDDFRSVRLLACGAEKLPVEVQDEFERKFGLRPVEGFGCTELSPVAAVNVPDRVVNGLRQVGTKSGTIGQPVPGVAVEIRDPESESALPIGEEGLLWVKGPNVMVGYLDQPEKTAAVVRDGWYNTGDMARLDTDGFITITGRLSRFAKIGGEMVPLERLEQEMHKALGTADRLLTVTSVPDPKRGERIVVLHLPLERSPAEVLEALKGRGMPNLWIPGERDFYPVNEFPVLGSGKLDLRGVQDMAKRLIG